MNRSKSSGEPSSQKIFRYSLDLMLVMACALLSTSLAVWLGLSPSFVYQGDGEFDICERNKKPQFA